jgi:hypothetical protein
LCFTLRERAVPDEQSWFWVCRGGLELLLKSSTKVHKVEVPPKDGEGKVTMKGLLSWVKANLIKERPEMFVKGDSVYVPALPPFLSISLHRFV